MKKRNKSRESNVHSLGRLHVDAVKWKGDPIGTPDTSLGRVYFAAFSIAGKSFEVGDFCHCGVEIFRIVGAFQATASFVGCWQKSFPVEIQKQGHPYILVVPLVWLHLNRELALPVASAKLCDGGHIDMLPQWLGEAHVAKMVQLSIHVGLKNDMIQITRVDSALVCNRAMTKNGRRIFYEPLTDEQESLLTCLPGGLLKRHVAAKWNPAFKAERVRLVHSKHSFRQRSRLPRYYTEDSSDDDSDEDSDEDRVSEDSKLRDSNIPCNECVQKEENKSNTSVSQLKPKDSLESDCPLETEKNQTRQYAYETVSPVEHVRGALLDESSSSKDFLDWLDVSNTSDQPTKWTENNHTPRDRFEQDFIDAVSPIRHVSDEHPKDGFFPTNVSNLSVPSSNKGPPRKRAEIKYNDTVSPTRYESEGFMDDSFSPVDFLNLSDPSTNKGPPRKRAEIEYNDTVSPTRYKSKGITEDSFSPADFLNLSDPSTNKALPRKRAEIKYKDTVSPTRYESEGFMDDSFSPVDFLNLSDPSTNKGLPRKRAEIKYNDTVSPTRYESEGFMDDSFSPADSLNLSDPSTNKGPPRKRAEIKYNDTASPTRYESEGFSDDSFSPADFLNLSDPSTNKGPPRKRAEIKYNDTVSPTRYESEGFSDDSFSPADFLNLSDPGPTQKRAEIKHNANTISPMLNEEDFSESVKNAGMPDSPIPLCRELSSPLPAPLSASSTKTAERIGNKKVSPRTIQRPSSANIFSPLNMSIPNTIKQGECELSISNISTSDTMETIKTTSLSWREARFLPKEKMNDLRLEAKAAKNRLRFFNTKEGKILRLGVARHILHHRPGKPLYCSVCGYSDKRKRRHGHRSCFQCKTCGYVPLCTRIHPGYTKTCWTEFHSKSDLRKRRPRQRPNKVKENVMNRPLRKSKRLRNAESNRRKSL